MGVRNGIGPLQHVTEHTCGSIESCCQKRTNKKATNLDIIAAKMKIVTALLFFLSVALIT